MYAVYLPDDLTPIVPDVTWQTDGARGVHLPSTSYTKLGYPI